MKYILFIILIVILMCCIYPVYIILSFTWNFRVPKLIQPEKFLDHIFNTIDIIKEITFN